MNTVEALKNLYKTMSGKDWPYDPNPTDAEVIDKIAADGSAGGSGGGGTRIIDLRTLQPVADDPQTLQYEPGLTVEDFANAYFLQKRIPDAVNPDILIDQVCHISWARKADSNEYITFIDSYDKGANAEYWYYPETGHLKMHLLD